MNKRFILLASVLGWVAALAFVAALARASVAQAAPAAQEGSLITVTVKAGDNLAKYTRLYGVSGASLRAANPQLKDPNLIFPGQTITIPVVQTFTPSLTTPFYYVVQSGDQLNALAKQFEQYPDVIAQANGLKNNILVLGQTLLIPAGPHLHYTVAGETLRSIGARYGVTVQFLLTGNNLPNPDRIFIGQPIFVPIIYNASPVPLSGLATAVPPAPTATAIPGATATPLPTVVGSNPDFIRITVRNGENFTTYVRRFGLSGGVIRQANPNILDPNIIHPGDIVVIPIIATFTPSRTTPFFYTVLAGETAASIAAKFEMATDTLTAANPGVSFTAGTNVLVPAGPHLYTVKAGDTMSSIAAKYGTTVDFLLTGNQLPNPANIFPGQQIFVPIQYNKQPVAFS